MGGPCTCDYSNLPRLGEFRAMVHATTIIVLGAGQHNVGLSVGKPDGLSAEKQESQDQDGVQTAS
jgi:hypothetical protein